MYGTTIYLTYHKFHALPIKTTIEILRICHPIDDFHKDPEEAWPGPTASARPCSTWQILPRRRRHWKNRCFVTLRRRRRLRAISMGLAMGVNNGTTKDGQNNWWCELISMEFQEVSMCLCFFGTLMGFWMWLLMGFEWMVIRTRIVSIVWL